MEVKVFEIRDEGTCIAAIAIKPRPRSESERWLLERSGYTSTPASQSEYVLLGNLDAGSFRIECDPFEWPGRTMHTAHQHIREYWDDLMTGDLIDVEFLTGVTAAPKVSDRIREQERRNAR